MNSFSFLILPPSSFVFGAIAQMGERLICIQEVNGSIPFGSIKILDFVRKVSA